MANYRAGDGRTQADVSTNLTLVKDTHSGVVINVIADAQTITLPAAAAGVQFKVRNGGAAPVGGPAGASSNGTAVVTIAPNGTDTIGGAGRTSANTSLVNTKLTSVIGDEVWLLGVAGAWEIVNKIGIWA